MKNTEIHTYTESPALEDEHKKSTSKFKKGVASLVAFGAVGAGIGNMSHDLLSSSVPKRPATEDSIIETPKTNEEPPVSLEVKGDNYPTNPFITNDLGPGEYTCAPPQVETEVTTTDNTGRTVTDAVTNNPGSETGGNAENTIRDINIGSNPGSSSGVEGGNGGTGVGGTNTSTVGSR